jgi:hypothetical protein
MRKLLGLFVGITLLAGCGHISGGVAPSNVPLAPNSYRELGEVRGTDCVYYLLSFIPLSAGNQTKKALSDALKQVPGTTALINVTADTYGYDFILLSMKCIQVEGIAVGPKLAEAENSR